MHLKEHCVQLKENQNCIKAWDFVVYDEMGNIHQVLCKFCGDAVKGWRQVGDPEVRRVPDERNTVMVIHRVALLHFANYREMLITFEDGSRHVTPICTNCVTRTFTLEELELCHLADMEELYDGSANDEQREAHNKFSQRKPTSHEEHLFLEGKRLT